ncbi:hypothetical protein TNCV_3012741 [Trichonephila clavipes]|nr:hypothetical protein TNCV_3012741 [Trichonephila clavipes]
MSWLLLRWIDGVTTAVREGCGSFARSGAPMKEGRIRSLYLPYRTQVLYRPRQNDRHRVIDEAHFWLNGYVNKQNCRISSEANPQVYVETPLHPEKLTVWCALWAGGILLRKR